MESLYQLIYFRYLILQVNVNWRNYKLHVDINIQHSLSWMYIFIKLARIDVMQLSYLQTCIQHSLSWMYIFIKLARIDVMQLSYLQTCLQHSLSWMYIFRRLTWIDINVVNLITIHVLIMLHNSCLSISCYTIFIAITRYLFQGGPGSASTTIL